MVLRIHTLHAFIIGLGTIIALPSVYGHPSIDTCRGYNAENIQVTETDLMADLILAGEGCGIYGPDVKRLSLLVQHQAGKNAP